MVSKEDVIKVMREFSSALNQYHKNTATSQFVHETLLELQKSEGVAFTGQLQYFFNRINIVKLSDNITYNDTEKASWKRLSAMNNLGNNLWGASL